MAKAKAPRFDPTAFQFGANVKRKPSKKAKAAKAKGKKGSSFGSVGR
jgi:hypothetical protein